MQHARAWEEQVTFEEQEKLLAVSPLWLRKIIIFAVGVLKARAKVRPIKSNLVFYREELGPLDGRNVLRAFYIAVEKAKIAHCRFHDLRHTFATRLVQAGVDLYKVQKLMRRKSPVMTQRSAHHFTERLRDGVDILDRISTNLAQSV